ncbi:MAG TPA: hypothetical protein IAB02_00575 [Candidatus Pullichristensenella excrementigallinarum]|uniref:Lipoprotein n=1 Tax=Candidatus Pullichristensenella excrementigallinarum TaxID=2840907 RepID=A0A9D1I9K2_9FIRM|nr:hypothetical protein [Candidatus Pullichristensenella excrementigallinarum]
MKKFLLGILVVILVLGACTAGAWAMGARGHHVRNAAWNQGCANAGECREFCHGGAWSSNACGCGNCRCGDCDGFVDADGDGICDNAFQARARDGSGCGARVSGGCVR